MTHIICEDPITNTKKLVEHLQRVGVAVCHDQNLSDNELVSFCKSIGECETPEAYMNLEEHPEIFKVTGKRNKDGSKIGMFGDTELGWHSNGNSRRNIDKICVTLYCKISDENTTTSFCNTSRPFYDLSEEQQEYYKDIKIRLAFVNNTIYKLDEDDPEYKFMSRYPGSIRPLVDKHPNSDLYYFYFPYHFIVKAWHKSKKIDHIKLIEELKPIIFRSKYQYHHIFKQGDLVLSDQLCTLHRRTPIYDVNRLLYRVAHDYQNS